MRLIDADALHEFVKEAFGDDVPYEWAWTLTVADHCRTVDAVEVVRCRDCVHRELRRSGYRCELNADPYAGPVVDGGDDEFCSYGERKTHETD